MLQTEPVPPHLSREDVDADRMAVDQVSPISPERFARLRESHQRVGAVSSIAPSDRLVELLNRVEQGEGSQRLALLHNAKRLALAHGFDPVSVDPNDMLDELRWFMRRLAMDEHYLAYPEAKPTPEMVVAALAQQLGHEAAEDLEVLRRAAGVAREKGLEEDA